MNLLAQTTKYFVLLISALVLFTTSHSAAYADELYTAAFTNGCFGAACSPGASASSGGLGYSNATFDGTTANGFRAVGGNANPGANLNNFGSISLSTASQADNTPFTLLVTFIAPQGISGSNTAQVTGTVRRDNTGGVFVDFNNTPVHFSYDDANCEPDPTGGAPGQSTAFRRFLSISRPESSLSWEFRIRSSAT